MCVYVPGTAGFRVCVHFGWMCESVYVNVCIYGCVECHVVCVVHSWHMCLPDIYVCLSGADAYPDRLVWAVLMVCLSRCVELLRS